MQKNNPGETDFIEAVKKKHYWSLLFKKAIYNFVNILIITQNVMCNLM